VREALGLEAGDMLVYDLRDDRVLLRSAPLTCGDPFATFDGWAGDEDARAYADL
jgi:bifunctional DNA-binding transcriptional regulator/antitoxin component of YhaV-PrlF toxin-antitoxin module